MIDDLSDWLDGGIVLKFNQNSNKAIVVGDFRHFINPHKISNFLQKV